MATLPLQLNGLDNKGAILNPGAQISKAGGQGRIYATRGAICQY